MNKQTRNENQQELKQFLEQQMEWIIEQDRILEKMEKKLVEMKQMAEYAVNHELSKDKKEDLNYQINTLKAEIQELEMRLHHTVH